MIKIFYYLLLAIVLSMGCTKNDSAESGSPSESTKLSTESSSYTSYVAIINQSGSGNPSATVMSNDLGGTVAWDRVDVGNYTATLTGAFTTGKTWVSIGENFRDPLASDAGGYTQVFLTSENVISITTGNGADVADEILTQKAIQIRVYE